MDVKENQKDLETLGQAKREAQIADEERAVLAAQVYQMQMEVSAKQASFDLECMHCRQVSIFVACIAMHVFYGTALHLVFKTCLVASSVRMCTIGLVITTASQRHTLLMKQVANAG